MAKEPEPGKRPDGTPARKEGDRPIEGDPRRRPQPSRDNPAAGSTRAPPPETRRGAIESEEGIESEGEESEAEAKESERRRSDQDDS